MEKLRLLCPESSENSNSEAHRALEATGPQCPEEARPQASPGHHDYGMGECKEAAEAGPAGQRPGGQEAGSGE